MHGIRRSVVHSDGHGRAHPCRRARRRKRRLRARRRRLGRAGRRPRRARDEGLAPVVQLGQGAGRHPGRRSARTTRRSSTRRTSGDARTRRPTWSSSASSPREAPGTIAWLEEHGVEFTRDERRLPAGALRRGDPQAAAPGRRSHGPRDHDGAARAPSRLERHADLAEVAAALALEPRRQRLARPLRRARDRGRRGRARGRRPLLPRGGGARRADDEPSRRDRRGDADRARAGRRGARPRRAPVPPERRRLAARRCRATPSPRRRAPTAPCS